MEKIRILLIAVFPVIFLCTLIRGLTVSKKVLEPETDSDGGKDCDYIQIESKTGSGSSRATILSFNTLKRMKSFFIKKRIREDDIMIPVDRVNLSFKTVES